MTSSFLTFGVRRDLTVKFAIVSIPKIKKAQILIVHGNPTSLMSRGTMMGKITPPRLEPDAMIPNAAARLLKNQVPIEPMAE